LLHPTMLFASRYEMSNHPEEPKGGDPTSPKNGCPIIMDWMAGSVELNGVPPSQVVSKQVPVCRLQLRIGTAQKEAVSTRTHGT
jgi:hypothetical protein